MAFRERRLGGVGRLSGRHRPGKSHWSVELKRQGSEVENCVVRLWLQSVRLSSINFVEILLDGGGHLESVPGDASAFHSESQSQILWVVHDQSARVLRWGVEVDRAAVAHRALVGAHRSLPNNHNSVVSNWTLRRGTTAGRFAVDGA